MSTVYADGQAEAEAGQAGRAGQGGGRTGMGDGRIPPSVNAPNGMRLLYTGRKVYAGRSVEVVVVGYPVIYRFGTIM